MSRRQTLFLNLFINRYDPKAKDALMQLLPLERRSHLLLENFQSDDIQPLLEAPASKLKKIHYSWFAAALKKFPDALQPILAASLTTEQIAGLKLKASFPIAEPIQRFSQNELVRLFKIDEFLPIEYLPESEFKALLDWKKDQLLNLIDFLGLHDLAARVKQIVNREHLKNIYKCLTPKQFYYLKMCLQNKDKVTKPNFPIDPAKVDPKELKYMLHKKGLARFKFALEDQSPDFIWHLAHHLDIGRGQFLLEKNQMTLPPKLVTTLKQQLTTLMNFLKSE